MCGAVSYCLLLLVCTLLGLLCIQFNAALLCNIQILPFSPVHSHIKYT